MAYTTPEKVAGIIEVDAGEDVSFAIDTANSLILDHCMGKGYSEAKLELIERWLAAHFFAVKFPRATAEKAGPVGENFQSKVDLALNVTHYGQQAMLLDSAGGLANYNAEVTSGKVRIKPSFKVKG